MGLKFGPGKVSTVLDFEDSVMLDWEDKIVVYLSNCREVATYRAKKEMRGW